MGKLMSAALCVVFVFAVSPLYAIAAASCKDTGSMSAKPLTFSETDVDTQTGLSVSFTFGLTPATFPLQDIGQTANPCKRGEFDVGAVTYQLFGTGDSPPRWAGNANAPGRIVYVALLPKPAPALAAYQAQSNATSFQFKPGDMMFVLAITDGDARQLYRFYDAIPDDSTLAGDMCAALSGAWKPIASFNTASGHSTFAGLGGSQPAVTGSACHARIP
ncbi:MAG: hypothetical protein ABSD74_06170 [Rhizomicrobium sp.]|jgi:hypothetical protein